MTERMRAWWTLRTTREQYLVLAMFGLFAITIAWVIILTVDNAVSDARERHSLAVIEHAEVAGKIAALKDIERVRPALTGTTVEATVGQAASEAGFVLSRNEPQDGGRVGIAIASARPQAFFGWINELERRGIFPEKLAARANSDRTLSIDATFRARGTR